MERFKPWGVIGGGLFTLAVIAAIYSFNSKNNFVANTPIHNITKPVKPNAGLLPVPDTDKIPEPDTRRYTEDTLEPIQDSRNSTKLLPHPVVDGLNTTPKTQPNKTNTVPNESKPIEMIEKDSPKKKLAPNELKPMEMGRGEPSGSDSVVKKKILGTDFTD